MNKLIFINKAQKLVTYKEIESILKIVLNISIKWIIQIIKAFVIIK